MRNFSWKYFTLTGDVESFMLYKEMDHLGTEEHPDSIPAIEGEITAEQEESSAIS